MMSTDPSILGQDSRGRRIHRQSPALAALAALGSLAAASTCCLPVLPFAAAAGLAGVSSVLSVLRPYLLAMSLLLVGYGFYRGRRARRCQQQPSVLSAALLWFSAAVVAISVLFPQAMANWAADLISR